MRWHTANRRRKRARQRAEWTSWLYTGSYGRDAGPIQGGSFRLGFAGDGQPFQRTPLEDWWPEADMFFQAAEIGHSITIERSYQGVLSIYQTDVLEVERDEQGRVIGLVFRATERLPAPADPHRPPPCP